MCKLKYRMCILTVGVVSLAIGVAIMLYNFRDNITLFYSPSEIMQKSTIYGQKVRIGGMVAENSVVRDDMVLSVQFLLTDYTTSVKVEYTGILPQLFREKQGVVATGSLGEDGVFCASEILTKHDEKYIPKKPRG
jgi:cytochrome c-type biogenesis protein CcmE